MNDIGILAHGAYIPMLRLQRSAVHAANSWFAPGLRGLAKGERAMANWDEDPITMAVEAARDCLGEGPRPSLASILFASTSAPFADRQNAGVIKEALNLPDAIGALDAGGSLKAGTSALLLALESADAGNRLVIAAEMRKTLPASEGEMLQGDAAASLLVGRGDLAARYRGHHSVTADFIDHFRQSGEAMDYGWEARWVREEGHGKLALEALKTGLARLGVRPESIAHFIGPPARGIPEMLAKKSGIRAEAVRDTLAASVGDSGAAHPLLLLSACLETAKAGETIAVLSFGQGVDLLVFEATGKGARPRLGVSGHLARRRAEPNYLKFLSFNGNLALDRGMRAEADMKQPLTALWRNRRTVLGLVGGRCSKTGTVQFPRSDIGVNPNDHTIGTQEDYPLADIPARIVSFTADSLTYSPDPPQHYGMIDFEGGGRMMAEFTDVAPGELAVGQNMRMMFRIKNSDERRGFTRYFWKAVPA